MIFFILCSINVNIYAKKNNNKGDIVGFYSLSYFKMILILLNKMIVIYMQFSLL